MANGSRVTDRARISRYLRGNVGLHLYEIGDLDPFFWPSTSWYAAPTPDGREAICLVYRHPAMSTLLALGEGAELAALAELIAALADELPDTFYAHTSPGLSDAIRSRQRRDHGHHLKMVLANPEPVASVDTGDTEALGPASLPEVAAFYRHAYPDSWFDPRMLETGQYFGIRCDGRLACVAGVHVWSPHERVAAIGNVATAPAHRGRGLARRATAAVCKQLAATVDLIGLN